ncbi:hypothetical protein [Thalassobellus suaedae]|uniref:Uncharacterized protein n=1 Tax=Thalassobellus suaedae TaxID=3074124 RepID=A0ABY9Y1U0_9FLAO|nr:hypothetical protein RHP49_13530 [Flavobacteriaceae bacterium HL-DH10]
MKKFNFLPLIVLTLFFSCSDNDNNSEMVLPDEENVNEANVNEEVCTITNKDGLLIIEAEGFELKGNWRIVEDDKASNGKYIEYFGANQYQTQNLANEITVKFKVTASGNYRVRWYMRQPETVEDDKSNDVWIYFPEDVGSAWINNEVYFLKHYEKFVSRGKIDFTYGGQLDMHDPKSSSWMTARFPEAGEYTLKICGRSQHFQLDKLVLSSGITDNEAKEQSEAKTETIACE